MYFTLKPVRISVELAIADQIVLEKFSLKFHSCKVFCSCFLYDYRSVACCKLVFPIVADVTELDVASD